MMGQQAGGQDQLFYSFNLEAHVPANHLLRGVDRFLDLSDLRKHLAAFYIHTGRPSIDPELTIRMLLIGYWDPWRCSLERCDADNACRQRVLGSARPGHLRPKERIADRP